MGKLGVGMEVICAAAGKGCLRNRSCSTLSDQSVFPERNHKVYFSPSLAV